MVFRSLLYGWLGAILAGLAVGMTGVAFGMLTESVVAVSTAMGVVVGVLGLSLPWVRQRARATATIRRRRR